LRPTPARFTLVPCSARVKHHLDRWPTRWTPSPQVVYTSLVGVQRTNRDQPRDDEANEDANVIESKAPPPKKTPTTAPDYRRKKPPANTHVDYHYRDVCRVVGCALRTAKRYVRQGRIPAPDYVAGRAVWNHQRLVEMYENGVDIPNSFPLQHSPKAAIARKAYRDKQKATRSKRTKKGRAA